MIACQAVVFKGFAFLITPSLKYMPIHTLTPIVLRDDPLSPANDIRLADSPIPSSAHDSDSYNSMQPNQSNLDSIPKGFHDIVP